MTARRGKYVDVSRSRKIEVEKREGRLSGEDNSTDEGLKMRDSMPHH